MLSTNLLVDVIKNLESAGAFTKSQTKRILDQIAYVNKALLDWGAVVEQLPSKREVISFIYQYCMYLLDVDTLRFCDAFNDLSSMETKQTFYKESWNSVISISSDFKCTIKDVYNVCMDDEYLSIPHHASPVDLINGTASEEQIDIFVECSKRNKNNDTDDAFMSCFSRIPEAGSISTNTDLLQKRQSVIESAVSAAKSGADSFLIKEECAVVANDMGFVCYGKAMDKIVMLFPDFEIPEHAMCSSSFDDLCTKFDCLDLSSGSIAQDLSALAGDAAIYSWLTIMQNLVDDVCVRLTELVNSSCKIQIEKRVGYNTFYLKLFEELEHKGYRVNNYDFYYLVEVV